MIETKPIPAIETKPIPAIARTAFALTLREFQRAVSELGTQTVAAVGGTESEHWTVNFETGEMSRLVPDAEAAL